MPSWTRRAQPWVDVIVPNALLNWLVFGLLKMNGLVAFKHSPRNWTLIFPVLWVFVIVYHAGPPENAGAGCGQRVKSAPLERS